MKNKLQKFFSAGLLSASAMCIGVALMTTGCSSDNSSVAGGDSEEYIEDVESGGDEGASSSSIAGKDKKGKSSSSEEVAISSSSENNGSSDTTRVESSSSENADSSSVEEINYAIKNKTVAGVAQKGPFVEGHAQIIEVDCETLKYGIDFEHFETDFQDFQNSKGEYKIENVDFKSPCAEISVWGYYLDEHTGVKSKREVVLNAFVNLNEHNSVNVNVFTELEYERMHYLVSQKGMSVTAAKEQAKKEIQAAFDIKGDVGDFVDLNILKAGDGNAALLAVSTLLTAQTDPEKNTHLTHRVDDLKESFMKTGVLDDEMKTEIANWAHSAKEKGLLETVRNNVVKYTDEVPEFEKYVEDFGDAFYDPAKDESSKTSAHTKEWQDIRDFVYQLVLEENTPETLDNGKCHWKEREDRKTNPEEYLMDHDLFYEEYPYGEGVRQKLVDNGVVWDGEEWDDERYPGVHYVIWLDSLFIGYNPVNNIGMAAGYKIRYTLNGEDHEAYFELDVKFNTEKKPYNPAKKEED